MFALPVASIQTRRIECDVDLPLSTLRCCMLEDADESMFWRISGRGLGIEELHRASLGFLCQ